MHFQARSPKFERGREILRQSLSLTDSSSSSPTTAKDPESRSFGPWLESAEPAYNWRWNHIEVIRRYLLAVTLGQCKRLAIATPPQHGKSSLITVRYPLYRMVRTPGLRVVVGAHSERFGYRIGRWTKQAATARHIDMGETDRQDEFELANGSTWLTRGVGAAVSGIPADLLVVDDPYGTAEDARSEVYRQKVADWYEEDLLGRLQSGGAVVLVHTRWGPDDLIGRRLLQEPEQWTYLPLPAICESLPDACDRPIGAALCPERFTIADLESKRAAMADPAAWQSLYQCNPLPRGGSFIDREWLILVEPATVPWLKDGARPPERVRAWDLAGTTKETSCYTAGVLLAKHSGLVYVEDVVRGRWVPSERNAVILQTAQADKMRPGFRKTYFEQEPGSSGIDAAQRLGQQLAGLPCEADRVTGDKDSRLEPFADQCRLGNVRVINSSWSGQFIGEVSAVPNGRYRDVADSVGMAYAHLSAIPPYFTVATVRY